MQNALRTLRTLLPTNTSLTRDIIDQNVNIVLGIPQFSHIDREMLIKEVETLYNIRAEGWITLEGKDSRRPWLNARREAIDWSFWKRYESYLEDFNGFAPNTLRRLDLLTDDIVDQLFDPSVADVKIDKRGLVVGQVQSGKTANYTGLICKAVDAGFKLVIVLAGVHNNLRAQTQLRLDEGFLGFDTQSERDYYKATHEFGVSQIRKGLVVHSITSSHDLGDFTPKAFATSGITNFDTREPILLVVKKNPSVLKSLLTWLRSKGQTDAEGNRYIASKSLLLIDDEADHASINTNKDPDKGTRINGQIRDVLRLFYKSAYVGYTATPFANIFVPIAADQLFPRDFIINLPAPTNYIGPEQVFGFDVLGDDDTLDDTLPIVHRVDDAGSFMPEKEREAPLPDAIPESLKRAIRCFLLVCAIRRLRGQGSKHNSMLIHVTRFNVRQEQITELVDSVFAYYKRGLDQNDPIVLTLMRQTFEQDSPGYLSFRTTTQRILNSPLQTLDPAMQVHSWTDVLPHLYPAAARIKVKEINGRSGDILDYYEEKEGLSVIAIGGDKLSRGLTLEGLSVSYFLRPSKMYDTLMQMGRWFGYRPGFVDLCRLFTSRELNEWFCHITKASEDLRSEFDRMASMRSTPDEYALGVQTHDGVLQVTAANKMRRAVEMRLSFAGRLVETYLFQTQPELINSNLDATRRFVAGLGPESRMKVANYIWEGVPAVSVVAFLNEYRVAKTLYRANAQTIAKFIGAQLGHNELVSWTVALMARKNPDHNRTTDYSIGGRLVKVGNLLRTADNKNTGDGIYYLKKSHIISPDHEFIDLTPEQYAEAMRLTALKREADKKKGEPDYPNGEIVRTNDKIRSKQTALLLLYTLDPEGAKLPVDSPAIIGYAISFPTSDHDSAISYAVHEQLVDYINLQDASDDEPDDNED
ncbi:Z1 domain-containing protein [Spirosoma pollinicola]|uniref:Endonuclease n=1 Tax=Spirosoma pollinicola TaxID=2057025 RepID=A0A2K8YXS2_9BACT|nr:Z1 domain-containing protein [Spirosoma pollinicola]AUD02430.1 endonuclease [Spirosoma pollinicola]